MFLRAASRTYSVGGLDIIHDGNGNKLRFDAVTLHRSNSITLEFSVIGPERFVSFTSINTGGSWKTHRDHIVPEGRLNDQLNLVGLKVINWLDATGELYHVPNEDHDLRLAESMSGCR